MLIQWLGRSCFKIQTKNSTDESTVVIDPFKEEKTGFKMPKIQADILLITHNHDDHNNADAIKGEPFAIIHPGEYEYHGVFVYGVPSFHDDKEGKERGTNTIYKIISEDLNIVHLGDLGHELTDEQLERLGTVDILMIPVGGTYTINTEKANAIIAQVEPRVIIPMHYKTESDNNKDLKPIDDFLKNCGFRHEKMDKFKITRKDLMAMIETKVVVLEV